MPKQYTVSDGKLVLVMRPAGKGWYAVTSPLDPGLITQARSVEEAFYMAYDAQKCLRSARAKLARRLGPAGAGRRESTPKTTTRTVRRPKRAAPVESGASSTNADE